MTSRLSQKTKKRLLRLADRFDKVKKKHFEISTWYGLSGEVVKKHILKDGFDKTKKVKDENGYKHEVLLKEGFCGSVACVLGHAALIEDFNDKGLYVDLSITKTDAKDYSGVDWKDRRYATGGNIVYKDSNGYMHSGEDAGREFFELDNFPNLSLALFGCGETKQLYGKHNPSPKDIAKGIRHVVKTDAKGWT